MRYSVLTAGFTLTILTLVLLAGHLSPSIAGTVGTPVAAPAPNAVAPGGWECYPDVNGDGKLSVSDIGWVVYYFGQAVPPAPPTTDLTGDGMVSVGDIGVIVQYYGQICRLY